MADLIVSGKIISAISIMAEIDLSPVFSEIECILLHIDSGRMVSRN